MNPTIMRPTQENHALSTPTSVRENGWLTGSRSAIAASLLFLAPACHNSDFSEPGQKFKAPTQGQESAQKAAPKPVSQPKPKAQQPKEVAVAANCDAFPDKLDTCSEYECEFVHPFTGGTMRKEIKGIVAKKCDYVEQMPNGGEMKCSYTREQAKSAAKYYRAVMGAKSFGVKIDLNLGSGEHKIDHTMDGKDVENPLQTFLGDGTCTISGY